MLTKKIDDCVLEKEIPKFTQVFGNIFKWSSARLKNCLAPLYVLFRRCHLSQGLPNVLDKLFWISKIKDQRSVYRNFNFECYSVFSVCTCILWRNTRITLLITAWRSISYPSIAPWTSTVLHLQYFIYSTSPRSSAPTSHRGVVESVGGNVRMRLVGRGLRRTKQTREKVWKKEIRAEKKLQKGM